MMFRKAERDKYLTRVGQLGRIGSEPNCSNSSCAILMTFHAITVLWGMRLPGALQKLPSFSVLASACAILYIYQSASGGSGPCALQNPSFWRVVPAWRVASQT
jgi:hypothetical protein